MLEQPVSRVLFLNPRGIRQWPFIWDACCQTPQATYPEASGGPPSSASLFGLAPGGVCQAPDVATGTGELLPHRFTLTLKSFVKLSRAVCFLLHFPWGRPRSLLATTLPCGARTFLRGTMSPGGHLVCSSKMN